MSLPIERFESIYGIEAELPQLCLGYGCFSRGMTLKLTSQNKHDHYLAHCPLSGVFSCIVLETGSVFIIGYKGKEGSYLVGQSGRG